MKEEDIQSKIASLSQKLSSDKTDIDLLHSRAQLFTKIQDQSSAINDYLLILQINPDDNIAKVKLEMLRTIVKYTNTDIYANPNTNLDPWLE